MHVEVVEAGVCGGLENQLHDLCIMNEVPHVAHIVDVIHQIGGRE